MNRLFLILPICLAVPIASSLAAPPSAKPRAAVPPAAKALITTKAPVKPRGPVPPGTKAPQAKPHRIKPPVTTHDHDQTTGKTNEAKPKDPVGDSLDYLWKQSDVAFHAGDYPTAVKIHRAIVTLDPTDTESFGVAAWLLWSMGQKSEARAFIQQGLDANPNNAEMWNVAGEHYDLEKSYPDAKVAYAKAVHLSGAKVPELLRHRLGHAAEHAGDLELSEQIWTELVRDFPNSPVDKNNLARVKALREKAG